MDVVAIPHPRGGYRFVQIPQTASMAPLTSDEVLMVSLHEQLTSAKEEIERLEYWEQFVCERCHGVGEITVTSGQTPESFSQENVPCPDCVGPIINRAESAESLLSAERKETERLREALEFYAHERIWVEIESDRGKKARAALHPPQQEEQ